MKPRNEKNILLLEIRVSNIIIDNASSGARSAMRLIFNHSYVDLQSVNSARRYYVRDHLGSVRAVVNDGGTTLESDDYYPLGGPLPLSSTSIQPEKYQGKDWNPAAGFNVYDFGARLYDPSVGLWLSQDPMAEKYYGVSPYAFCGDNPMVFVDPDGKIFSIKIRRETITITATIYTNRQSKQSADQAADFWNSRTDDSYEGKRIIYFSRPLSYFFIYLRKTIRKDNGKQVHGHSLCRQGNQVRSRRTFQH